MRWLAFMLLCSCGYPDYCDFRAGSGKICVSTNDFKVNEADLTYIYQVVAEQVVKQLDLPLTAATDANLNLTFVAELDNGVVGVAIGLDIDVVYNPCLAKTPLAHEFVHAFDWAIRRSFVHDDLFIAGNDTIEAQYWSAENQALLVVCGTMCGGQCGWYVVQQENWCELDHSCPKR
jgi:hypothetical protein